MPASSFSPSPIEGVDSTSEEEAPYAAAPLPAAVPVPASAADFASEAASAALFCAAEAFFALPPFSSAAFPSFCDDPLPLRSVGNPFPILF